MIRWGIIGAGKIAHRFARGLFAERNSELVAISGRSKEKLNKFAEEFPCKKQYTDYEEIIRDDSIQAVYIALPNGLHKEWSIKALNAGKAVLCEKPSTIDVASMEEIAKVAKEKNILFMEAMKSRFTPMYEWIKNNINEVIGDVRRIETTICFELKQKKEGNLHYLDAKQGGCLRDSGIYCVSWLDDYFSEEAVLEHLYVNLTADGLDRYVQAELRFGEKTATVEVGYDRNKENKAIIYGTKGTMIIPDLHRPHSATISNNKKTSEINITYEVDDFYSQIHHFVECLIHNKNESNIMSLENSLSCQRILEVIRKGYTNYDEKDLAILEKQEELLQLSEFNNEIALKLGNTIATLAKEYDRGVSVRIIKEPEDLVIFQYMMDGKTKANEVYMMGKRQSSIDTNHSSAWVFVKQKMTSEFDHWKNDGHHLISGGAFPIRVNHQLIATVMVSGLHEGKDHELIVRALQKMTGVQEVPVFYKALS